MNIKAYNYLPDEAIKIRTEVFVNEQGFQEEFDSTDEVAVHLIAYENDIPVGVCRYFWNDKKQAYIIGRFAVIKKYRGKNVGAELIKRAEEDIRKKGGKKVCLASQKRAMGFYEKQEYSPEGGEFFECDCPHVWMSKLLRAEG